MINGEANSPKRARSAVYCNVSRFLSANCQEVSNSVSMAINYQEVLRCKGGTLIRTLFLLIIKPTRCTNFSNLFLE